MPTCDVAVVGGGPAGAAAAIRLAQAGRDVIVLDKARFPRDKACGDGLTTGALRRLESLGLDPRDIPSWERVEQCIIRSNGTSGYKAYLSTVHGKGTWAAVARRTELDAALLDVARAAGAKVYDGHAFQWATVATGGETLRLDVDGLGEVQCRYAIGADGMWSPLRKAVGAEGDDVTSPGNSAYLGTAHAFRQYFTHVAPAASSAMWVWFEDDLLPGYAWSFPLPGNRANVGYGIMRSEDRGAIGKWMKQTWPDVLARPHIAEVLGPNAKAESPHKAWPIPAEMKTAPWTACGGRIIFVGDAMRACDPMTGEGIGQALETAELAAEAIVAAGALRPWVAEKQYRKTVGLGLGVDNSFAHFLSRLAQHRKGVRAGVRMAGLHPWITKNFSRWLFEDYPRAALLTPHRWKRGFINPPVAPYASLDQD